MSETFAEAASAVLKKHHCMSWSALTHSERAEHIYAEMRKIDAESVKGWLVIGDERKVAYTRTL